MSDTAPSGADPAEAAVVAARHPAAAGSAAMDSTAPSWASTTGQSGPRAIRTVPSPRAKAAVPARSNTAPTT